MSVYDFFVRNLGKIIGGIAGLLVSIILLAFGFWKGIFIIFCIAVGAFLGWRWDNGEQMRSFFDRIIRRRED